MKKTVINRTIKKLEKLLTVPHSPLPIFTLALFFFLFSLFSCTFDYGEGDSSGDELPDLVMENVEYVRVRASDPIARFKAERAERYEKLGKMKLQNLTFEQYGERGNEINSIGKAGSASVDIDTGDVFMDKGVRVEVESEDIIIETFQLEWRDEARTITSGEGDEVTVYRDNGTNFIGIGLRANARTRTWEFLGRAGGTFIYDDDEEPEEENADEMIDYIIDDMIGYTINEGEVN